jgi:hypothetical protein
MNIKIVYKYLILSLFVLILSCKNDSLNTVSKPKNLLTKNQMAEIIVDMHIAEAGLNASNLSLDSLKNMSAGYDSFIFDKYQIKEDDFEKSYDYYLCVPYELDSVYQNVIELLNAKESKSKGILIAPKQK